MFSQSWTAITNCHVESDTFNSHDLVSPSFPIPRAMMSSQRSSRSSISLMLELINIHRHESSPDVMSISSRTSITSALKSPVATELEVIFPRSTDKHQIQHLLSKFRTKGGRSSKDELKSVRKLHESISKCDYRACYKVLADKTNPNAVLKGSTITPIHAALSRAEDCVASDNKATVQEAIRIVSALAIAGANLDVRDAEGRTPLIRVAKGEMTDDLATLLLDFGANVNDTDTQGNSALHYAAMSPALTEMGNVNLIQILMQHGASHGTKNERGRTPLFKAVLFGHIDRAQDLLKHCADLSTTDNHGRTPLYTAVIQGHTRLTELLCAGGAFVDVKDNNGQTPLHYAISRDHTEIVEVLLAAGADTNLVSKGETPLCRATSKCNLQLLDVLLRHGADPSVPSPNYGGARPLHIAAIGTSIQVVQRLLEAGSSPDLQDDEGRTPLEWAEEGGKEQYVALFQTVATGS